jgi:hypothetical protein
LKCPLLQMAPQHTITTFEQDNDFVRYYIVGGNNNNGQPAFQVNADTGALSTSVTINFETGPRFYQLQVNSPVDPEWLWPPNYLAEAHPCVDSTHSVLCSHDTLCAHLLCPLMRSTPSCSLHCFGVCQCLARPSPR